MLIHKVTKSVEDRIGFPNVNWINSNDYYLVDSNSELGNKIKAALGHQFDVVLNDNGEVIDITITT